MCLQGLLGYSAVWMTRAGCLSCPFCVFSGHLCEKLDTLNPSSRLAELILHIIWTFPQKLTSVAERERKKRERREGWRERKEGRRKKERGEGEEREVEGGRER